MPSLRTLKLDVYLSLYNSDDHKGNSPRSRSQLDARATERQRVIQDIVDNIFWKLEFSCPDLAVVVLGVEGPEEEDEGIHRFLRSWPIEVDGELTPVGVPVERHMVKYHEPCSEIMEREAFGLTDMQPPFELRPRSIPRARYI